MKMRTDSEPHVRLVIADDQLLVREGLTRVFGAVPGMEVVGVCSDGDEVVDAVRATNPDIVLLDMRMKRVDGATALQRLEATGSRPPVLVLTTFDDEETLGLALNAGAEGFMLKESVGIDLTRAVRTVAGGGAWIDPAVAGMVISVFRNRFEQPKTADVSGLTEREVEVLRLMALGRTNSEIADELFISERTVKTHVGHVFTKLEVRDRVGAVIRAFDCGLVEMRT